MGIGTLAFYGRPGDDIRFYEIDEAASDVALSHFSFVADSEAEVTVVIGDARTSLERESANSFDILFLDAFSSDSIPVHLLTREAFDIYARHLSPDAVIAVNISTWNRYFAALRPTSECRRGASTLSQTQSGA
jgi:spermidine synthase